MPPDSNSPNSTHSSPTCYFSIVPAASTHFSVETPSTSAYSPDSFSDPAHPLLAYRQLPILYQTSPAIMDAPKVLQLQTAAANQPLQHNSCLSPGTPNSSSSPTTTSSSTSTLCCSRCRRSSTSQSNMVRFGTNLYYCRHCASMVGYSPG